MLASRRAGGAIWRTAHSREATVFSSGLAGRRRRRSPLPSSISSSPLSLSLSLSLAFSRLRSSCLVEPAALAMLHATTGRGALLLRPDALPIYPCGSCDHPVVRVYPKTRRDPRRRRITGRRKGNGRKGGRGRDPEFAESRKFPAEEFSSSTSLGCIRNNFTGRSIFPGFCCYIAGRKRV